MKLGLTLSTFFTVAFLATGGILDDFQNLPDNRTAVRTSFGVRYARPISPTQIEIGIGMSITGSAANAAAYRVISDKDPGYAYEKFVSPVRVETKKEREAESPEGCPFQAFDKTTVVLQLPTPMQAGCRYDVVAQGYGGEMVTGAHTAQGFVYNGGDMPAAPGNSADLAVLGLRNAEPAGNGVLKLEFGPNFSAKNAVKPENYKISIGGSPVKIVNLGRISRIDTYLPVGWPFVAIPQNEVYIQLASAYKDGDNIKIEVDKSVTKAHGTASINFDSRKTFSNSIKVNQIGYITDSPVKIAYLGRWMGSFPEIKKTSSISGQEKSDGTGADSFWNELGKSKSSTDPVEGKDGKTESAAKTGDKKPAVVKAEMGPALAFDTAPEFNIISENGGNPVFTGKAKLIHISGVMNEGVYNLDHSGENVYVLDFTQFKTPGRYVISVNGVGKSLPFSIADDVYKKAFEIQSYGVFAQRCGIELKPPYSNWRRIACHNNGLELTTQIKGEQHSIGDLPKKVILKKISQGKDPSLDKLDKDPDMLAHYPLDGDFNDVSGKGYNLLPIDKNCKFSEDNEISVNNKVYGPTMPGTSNGAKGVIPIKNEKGLSIAIWFKKDNNNEFQNTLFGFGKSDYMAPKMLIGSNWGVISCSINEKAGDIKYERINNDAWRHLALVVTQDGKASFYCDGKFAGAGKAWSKTGTEFLIGAITGNGAGNAYFDDCRVYSRVLSPEEIKTLGTKRPGEAPLIIKASGGHHDAGDYNPRSHIDVAQKLMETYEIAPKKFYDGQLNIPEKGNGIPDILDEAYWALKLWMDLQDADGGVRNGTESAGDPTFIQTVELDTTGDYAYAKDAPGSYTFAGAMAQASRLWKSGGKPAEADDFLKRAVKAYEWADKNPIKQQTPALQARDYLSPKAYASAQLLHTTGDQKYNKDFLSVCVWSKKLDSDIDVYGLYDQSQAAWAYVCCDPKLTDPAIVSAIKKAIIGKADIFISHSSKMAYAFIRHPWAPINWGTGAYENWLTQVAQAWKLTGDEKYRYWIIRTCDNTLGANPLGLSYVVGAGTKTVRAPLHNSRYGTTGEVVDGMQVEGPVQKGEGYRIAEVAYPKINEKFACLYTFVDNHFAIVMDEGVVANQAQSMAVFGLLLPDKK